MKQLVLVALISALFTQASFAASWFTANGDIYVGSERIEVQIVNNQPYPITCRGKVFGQDAMGNWVEIDVNIQSIGVGSYAYAYLYTYGGNYFVRGYANIQCKIRMGSVW